MNSRRSERFENYQKSFDLGLKLLKEKSLTPNEAQNYNLSLKHDGLRRTAFDLLAFPDIDFEALEKIWPEIGDIDVRIKEALYTDACYAVYMERQRIDIERNKRDAQLIIPENIVYEEISGLSHELQLKLNAARPRSIAQATQYIEGMTPAALSLIVARTRQLTRINDNAA